MLVSRSILHLALAALALFGIGTDWIGVHPGVLTQGTVSATGALAAVIVAMRA